MADTLSTGYRLWSGYICPAVLASAATCQLEFARQLIYSDGVNLDSRDALVPVGVTCKLGSDVPAEVRAAGPAAART